MQEAMQAEKETKDVLGVPPMPATEPLDIPQGVAVCQNCDAKPALANSAYCSACEFEMFGDQQPPARVMRMTPELAKRIVERPVNRNQSSLSDAKRTEILMDWLEGMSGKDIQAKHGVSKSLASGVVTRARRDARALLGKIAEDH